MPSLDEKYNIICLSNQLWDFPNWTNKRHVMSRLGKLGHSVLFVDPPLNLGFVFLRQLYRGLWGFPRIVQQLLRDPSGTYVYTPLNIVPFTSITTPLHVKRIKSLAKKLFKQQNKTILWVYNVQLRDLSYYLDHLDYDVLVYDCVDNYAGFPQNSRFYSTTIGKDALIEQEHMLTKRAKIVFATAPGLVDRLKLDNANVHFTPNVGDYEKFKNARSLKNDLPQDLKNIPRPRIGYIGALDEYKFDFELLKKIALEHPDYSFVIIGQLAIKDKEMAVKKTSFGELHNIYFLGTRPYELKSNYLAGFDVDLIPYELNDYTVGGCFPVKFHDSLAAGLPVVVTDLPAYRPFAEVCYISKDYNEFSKNITLALSEDSPQKISMRQAVARENNWDGKVTNMLNIIRATCKL